MTDVSSSQRQNSSKMLAKEGRGSLNGISEPQGWKKPQRWFGPTSHQMIQEDWLGWSGKGLLLIKVVHWGGKRDKGKRWKDIRGQERNLFF